MTENKFNYIISFLWKSQPNRLYFDFPKYGGLGKKAHFMSPEAVDAMQMVWPFFISGKFKNKQEFKIAYKKELNRLGENIEKSSL
jgi:hypothetical protein